MSYQEEQGYLQFLHYVFMNGNERSTRNGNTIGVFGGQLSFSLLNNKFPLLTTKKMFTKGIIGELLWFLNGRTDNKLLKEQGIHIWDGNSSSEYLESRGLDYKEDECGPIYGYQWRRFNCPYEGCDKDICEVPIKVKEQDQLAEVIRLIKEDPMSRRIIISGWNPCQLKDMCLEPCHTLYQFYVHYDKGFKYLTCQLYQRSADLFLGVPFNIASCALLTYIVAKMTDCIPYKIIITFGDAHIYVDHKEQVLEQLSRRPFTFPTLSIKYNKNDNLDSYDFPNNSMTLDDLPKLKIDDFKIEDYMSYLPIKAKMNV